MTLTGEGQACASAVASRGLCHPRQGSRNCRFAASRSAKPGHDLMQDMAGILVEADDVSLENNRHPTSLCMASMSRVAIVWSSPAIASKDDGRSDRGGSWQRDSHVWNSRDNRIEGNEILNYEGRHLLLVCRLDPRRCGAITFITYATGSTTCIPTTTSSRTTSSSAAWPGRP